MAHADPALSGILEDFGAEGFGVWWLILEDIAAAMEAGSPRPEATHSEVKWAQICYCSVRRFRSIRQGLAEKQLIVCTSTDDLPPIESLTKPGRLKIEVRNILKYRDEYSRKSGHSPDSRVEQRQSRERTEQRTFPTTEQAACGNVENSRRKPVLPPEEYRAQHPPMNEAAFSKLLDSKDLNHFQNEIPKPLKPTPNAPDYLLSPEERAQPRNGSTKPREVIAIPIHPATELERMTEQLLGMVNDSPEWNDLAAEIVRKKASIEMKTKELEGKLR